MPSHRVSRRRALAVGAAAAALPLVHIRTAGAAGRLAVALWDHWVPTCNDVMRRQVQAWADANKVDVRLDTLTSIGNKIQLTSAAESQARTGHDVITFVQWDAQNYARQLEPLDDVMARLSRKYGDPNTICHYLGKHEGRWVAVPSGTTTNKGPCGRISVLRDVAGIDVVKMYPPEDVRTSESAAWTWDTHLKAAEACHKAGMAFGIGLGTTTDSVDTAGSLLASFGAELMDSKGNITINSDAMRQALEHGQRLVRYLPADAASWDDASNNRALISGKSALIWNPPSAWAVAKRDAPQVAADCWTFPAPAGPKGRFMPYLVFFWGIWQFAQNKSAAKELIEWLSEREQEAERVTASQGFDLPPFPKMTDLAIWRDAEPPKGTLFNYPTRASSGQVESMAAYPAPPDIGVQIYNRGTPATMLAKLQNGQSIPSVIAWAENELKGFAR